MNAHAPDFRRRVVAVIGVVMLTGLASLSLPLRVAAQISPGPLARPHRTLEGAQNCVSCHGLKRQPMTQGCLSRHLEID